MNKKNFLTINAVLIFCLVFITAQYANAQRLDSTISIYADKFSQERMYVHYDKPSYSTGETVWFKTYLMEDIFPAAAVKTVYLDWTDEAGKIILHGAYPVNNGVANGQFDIPADYTGKSMHVRGYTRWMLNFDTSFLYNKDIRILSMNKSTSKAEAIIPTLQFFPEGGDAIAGIPNKIAFKANDQWGRPLKVKGTLTDNKGKIITAIQSIHDGLGYFLFAPALNTTYTVKWKSSDKGTEHITAMPAIKQSGVVMQVGVSGSKRILSINAIKDGAQTNAVLHIVGTMYQNKIFEIAAATDQGPVQKSIPTQSLPSGVLTITVFDDNWNAVAERITYVNNNESVFQPEMEVKQYGLSKRAKNQIQITVPDSLVASLSIAVTDIGIDTDSSNNIVSHLLLSSQLKGDVYNSSYYFSNTNDSVQQHLDLVMLTHGWRRFNWEDVVAGKLPKINFARDTSYLSLSGKIFGVLPTQLRGAGDIIMFVKQKDSTSKTLMIPVKPDGTFRDPTQIFFDTIHVYYTFPKSSVLSEASVQFMNDRLAPPVNNVSSTVFPYLDTVGNYRHNFLVAEANRIREMMAGKILEEVVVRAKTKSPIQILDEKYASGLFKSGDGYQFDLVNDKFAGSAQNIFTYLQGKVAGLQINTNGGTPTLDWRGSSPALFLDEMNADASLLSNVNVNDIAYVKVFRPPFIGAIGGGAGGAIAIYTRRGQDVKPIPGKGLTNNVVYGYTAVRQFYSPNYGTFDKRNEEKDFRTTLYWNPNIVTTPKRNQVILTFYNNDVSDFFRVVIEGMTADGRLAHVEQIVE